MIKVKSTRHLVQRIGNIEIERPASFEFLLDEESALLGQEAGVIEILEQVKKGSPRKTALNRETK
jgi:hypothetical protein